ncbi:STAS domain-containing protein [Streptomyces sp. NBC_01216]|uniref:STAS domain-containing protein n=1 Tax=unclassified Streptomyces TaxID=2593676 RepID=UPI002E0DD517|nr:STAS domain-containing protein [Streptomyces sp. NBC_01216]
MSTAQNPPILTDPAAPSAPEPHDQGADAAPCGTSVRSCSADDGKTLRVALQGEVDHYSAGPLRVLLAVASVYGYRRLVLDTSRVTFADSALLRILRGWTGEGRWLRLTGVTPAMQRLRAAAWGPPPGRAGRAPTGKGTLGEGA